MPPVKVGAVEHVACATLAPAACPKLGPLKFAMTPAPTMLEMLCRVSVPKASVEVFPLPGLMLMFASPGPYATLNGAAAPAEPRYRSPSESLVLLAELPLRVMVASPSCRAVERVAPVAELSM